MIPILTIEISLSIFESTCFLPVFVQNHKILKCVQFFLSGIMIDNAV